eukprot:TRINITY_DN19077_c0_g1_i1.p1 TRINITY_DN19077_c0_g1~~TRINITY_DN19077_c0_g1_i1.p1  ORF type:complete len:222 (-),score=39.62 TRINITY_DN19077_c0_g1_i1:443-1108(-)
MSNSASAEWALESAIKSGYLLKQGQKWRAWRKRLFVLTTTNLYYYKGMNDHMPTGDIPLNEVSDVQLGVEQKQKMKKHTVQITRSDRIYLLATESAQEAKDWLNCINNAVKQATEGVPVEQETSDDENEGEEGTVVASAVPKSLMSSIDSEEGSSSSSSKSRSSRSGSRRFLREVEEEEFVYEEQVSCGNGEGKGNGREGRRCKGGILSMCDLCFVGFFSI